jgi:hypothetical protein
LVKGVGKSVEDITGRRQQLAGGSGIAHLMGVLAEETNAARSPVKARPGAVMIRTSARSPA